MAGKVKDITGQRFGRWRVLGFRRVVPKHGAYFDCRCDCGIVRAVLAKSLKWGRSKSCGCIQKLTTGEAACRAIFRSYQRGAERRGLTFNLTLRQFKNLAQSNCHYCGSKPAQHHKNLARHYNGGYTYNGIDRRSSRLGYTVRNCVPACGICNLMKKTMSVDDFINHCSRIAVNHIPSP